MKNLLIIKLSSLGDVIHTLPAAQALRRAYPHAHLAWGVERIHAAVLRGQPWLDEVIEHDRRSLRTYFDFIQRLRRTKWDAVIDFQGLVRSGATAWLSGAKRRIGHAHCKEPAHWFYNEKVPLGTLDQHAVDRSYHLATHLGARLDGMPLDRPYLSAQPPVPWHDGPRLFPLCIGDDDRQAAEQWLAQQGHDRQRHKLIIMHSHARRSANLWPTRKYAQLARLLRTRDDLRVILTGGPAAQHLCDEIAAGAGGLVWRADGRMSLMASTELIRQAAVMVTCDSGPMHLAAAVGTPLVALFGPTNPVRTGPYCTNAIAIDKRLPCGHCKGKICPRKLDPPQCMAEIEVAEVYAAIERQLAISQSPLVQSSSGVSAETASIPPGPHFPTLVLSASERPRI